MDSPPNKYRIEKLFLQQIITYPEILKTLNVKPEHFYHKAFCLAFKTIQKMLDDSETVSWPTFGSRFYDAGGKVSEISLIEDDEFISHVYSGTNLKILAEELAKRKIWKKYGELKNAPLEFIAEMKKIEIDFIEKRFNTIVEDSEEYEKEYNERKKRVKKGKAISLITGFKFIDQNIGIEKKSLVILAAKTSVGKSALALNIALNASLYGQRVLFISAEMTISRLMDRVYAQLTGVSATKFKYANADHSLPLARNDIKEIKDKLKFIYLPQGTSEEVCRLVNREAQIKPIDLIVVDYIQLLKDTMGRGETNAQRVGNITSNLRGLATTLNCSVLALSQVNREATGRPKLHNLRDSGCIEQDSDIVLILHREGRGDVVASLEVAKARDGKVGECSLKFNPELTLFSSKTE